MDQFDRFWKRLRPPRPAELDRPKTWDLIGALHRAATKADIALRDEFSNLNLDRVVISRICTLAVQTFLEAWYDELRHGESSHLITIVLEDRDLSVDELKAFVQALPSSLIERIVRAPSPEASGLQALLAIEKARRDARCGDFSLSRDLVDDKLVVTFNPPEIGGRPLSFKLDERFEL